MGDAYVGRRGKPYRKLCAQVRARRDPCALCGHPIDYDAPPRTRWSFSLEHVVSLAHGGSLLDPANVTAAHYGCNSRRGGRTRRHRPEPALPPVVVTSRMW
jgi:5-methylcytosine-specific restriction endonuclease McrA